MLTLWLPYTADVLGDSSCVSSPSSVLTFAKLQRGRGCRACWAPSRSARHGAWQGNAVGH